MQDAPIFSADLEIRAGADGSRTLSGRFPYNSLAVMHSGGRGRRPRKERFAPRAFEWVVNQPDREVHALIAHSFDKPIASRKAGTLSLRDTDAALEFVATITPAIQQSSWWQDFNAAWLAGLVGGVSPGFRVAPPEAVDTPPETEEEEDPSEGEAIIRTIHHAVLFELSLVTRPAYDETEIDLRSQNISPERAKYLRSAAWRWRR